jgi:hypothetical protein
MAKNERRKTMPVDEVYIYFRRLELKLERPSLFKLCNAIKTVDLALETDAEGNDPAKHFSTEAWSRVRNELFHILLTNFPGYFLVYETGNPNALESGMKWPESGHIEFYPEKILRRFETYDAKLENLQPQIITCLRWCFGQDRQNITPSLFSTTSVEGDEECSATQSEAMKFLDRLYEICEEEANQGKKIAHRRWWQLYWEANGCTDRRQRNELQKMLSLQAVWGRPAQLV